MQAFQSKKREKYNDRLALGRPQKNYFHNGNAIKALRKRILTIFFSPPNFWTKIAVFFGKVEKKVLFL